MKTLLLNLVITVFLFSGCGDKKNETSTQTNTGTNTTNQTNTQTTSNTTTQTQTKDSVVTQDTAKKDGTKVEEKNEKKSNGDVVNMKTSMGDIKIKLFTDKAPITAGNFKSLVEKGFYDGIIFHRVIDGFMIQGGDPTGTGRGDGKTPTIKDEFGAGLKHDKKGILSMANAGPNTGSSQFFITLDATPWLDGKHAIFGEVIEGMSVVEKIGKTKTGPGDRPVTEVKMTKVTIE